jgi:hypothetical protein
MLSAIDRNTVRLQSVSVAAFVGIRNSTAELLTATLHALGNGQRQTSKRIEGKRILCPGNFTYPPLRCVPGRGAMGGWDRVRARLIGDAEGRPVAVFFSTCHDTVRTPPALQHDTARPEDVNTSGEDHAADEIRYACMSRP